MSEQTNSDPSLSVLRDDHDNACSVWKTEQYAVLAMSPDPDLNSAKHNSLANEAIAEIRAGRQTSRPASRIRNAFRFVRPIRRALLFAVKWIPPAYVMCLSVTEADSKAIWITSLFALFVAFGSCATASFSEIQELAMPKTIKAVSLSKEEGLLCLHGSNYVSVPLNTVHFFCTGTKVEFLSTETRTPLGSWVRASRLESHHVECVSQSNTLIFDCMSVAIGEQICSYLNRILSQWRDGSELSLRTPVDVMGIRDDGVPSSRAPVKNNTPLTNTPVLSSTKMSSSSDSTLVFSRKIPEDLRMIFSSIVLFFLLFFSTIMLPGGSSSFTISSHQSYGFLGLDIIHHTYDFPSAFGSEILQRLFQIGHALFLSFWWTRLYMKNTTFGSRFLNTTLTTVKNFQCFRPVRWLTSFFLDRETVYIGDVAFMELIRSKATTVEDLYRAHTNGATLLGGPRYSIALYRTDHAKVYEASLLVEGDALFLAHCLRTRFPSMACSGE